jgi:F-type H+-transporting ATPase subunit delta
VASAQNVSHALTTRYATALIELAEESGKSDKIAADLDGLLAMVKDSADLRMLVSSPSISRKSQLAAISALSDKAGFDLTTKNFLSVLVQNRRLNALKAIINTFKETLAKRRGEITVQVETAQDLSPSQLKALQEALTKGMKREVQIRAKVEPSILGGMVVTVGSQMIDDSVRHKLEKLKAAMGTQANQNLNTNKEAV